MKMIELYAYQSDPRTKYITPAMAEYFGVSTANAWDAAKADYNASPVRGKAFCTLPRHEQVEIVRKYVNREV